MEWWGTREKPNKRLRGEAAVMRKKFPEGRAVRICTAKSSGWPKPDFWIFVEKCRLTMTSEGQLRWKIRFRFWEDDKNWQFQNSPNEYTFTLIYPGGKDYPIYPPKARITTLIEGGPPHLYKSDEIYSEPCVFDPHKGRAYGWDPIKDTAAVMAGWVVEWLLAYRVWRKTGKWPRPVSHNGRVQ